VAEPSEAGTPAARTAPESGVTGSWFSLIVTVPDDGFVHEIVSGWPAVTDNVAAPPGIVIALFCCADTATAHRAATRE